MHIIMGQNFMLNVVRYSSRTGILKGSIFCSASEVRQHFLWTVVRTLEYQNVLLQTGNSIEIH
jgi:hypothetical protein